MAFSKAIARLSIILAFAVSSACAHSQDSGTKVDQLGPRVPVAAQTHASSEPQAVDSGWPQTFMNEDRKITVYPPQVEAWSGDTVKERAVISVQKLAAPQATYGEAWLEGKTKVDTKTHKVTFDQVRVTKASFPSDPHLADAVLKTLRKNESQLLKPVTLENLQSSLAIGRVESSGREVPLRNGPPKIVSTRVPTLLVLVDGSPALRDSGVPSLMRVVNTRALILYDSIKGRYFFYMGDRWMDALKLQGPWIETDQPSPNLEQAKKIAVDQKQVDLLNDPNSPLMKELAQHIIPHVYVSTEPTEILETEGKPEFQSIAGTKLLYVSNTKSNIFLDQTDQKYYVLLSGRWYQGKTLDGPWKYVPANKLPKDFAKIPETHRKGSVLASVPGTSQAGEARLSNQVPQTAKVDREQVSLDVKYDGDPQFKPIEGTKLQYAENSKTAVIQIEPHQYYALQSGVWFESNSPKGPWKVASRVPAVIYTIPPSSPLYYATYVRVYDSTPDSVYVAYTPGYLGSYCCDDGVVVYGTGYYYPPWIGTYWIGPPVTFGVGFFWGYGGGFYAGPAFYPWWGPWWTVPVYVGYPYAVTGSVPVGQGTVYQGWSSGVVQTKNPVPFQSAYLGRGGQWATGSSAGVGAGSAWSAGPSTGQVAPAPRVNPPASAWNPPPTSHENAVPWSMGPGAGSAAGVAPHIAAPAPPPPSAPALGGHAGAMSHGFPGGGWGGGHGHR